MPIPKAKTALFVNKQPGGMFSVVDQGMTTGDIWFVDSTHAAASDTAGFGRNPEAPVATIDYAVGLCTANKGDIIYVAPGHTETLAAAADLALDVAGITIIGLGNGTNKPTVSFGTATTADVDIDAANITVKNIRFVSAIDSLAVMLDVNAAYFTCIDCDFITSSALECINFVNLATTVDNFTFRRCRFIQPSDPAGTDGAAATGCFYFVDSQYILVEECYFEGNFETAIFHNKTTKATNVWINNCWGTQALAAALVAILVDDATGGMARCSWLVPNAADVVETSFMTLAATTPFGFHDTTFMNDGAGGNNALPMTGDAT